jgi:hypothetical protein
MYGYCLYTYIYILNTLSLLSFNTIFLKSRYNWNIVESGVKHHNPTLSLLFCIFIFVPGEEFIEVLCHVFSNPVFVLVYTQQWLIYWKESLNSDGQQFN